MQNQMQKFGLKPEVCTDGKQALAYCRENPLPNLILLDGYMPEMDGIAFLKELRKMPDGDKPFVLFCSSSMDRMDVDEALRIGANCHFPKPISHEQFVTVLTQVYARVGVAMPYKQA